ncbi:hypothetical protein LCGC14_1614060 [marine sediment metagenome]|uniref:HTH marR-type domain-containing protein n=1 Tax=marine sediment metagenome TaxID=412755 RepID=A0A0F9IU93_9ZZZZ
MIDGQKHCLNALHGLTYPHEVCVPFIPIQDLTGYDRRTVRRHVRALARKGLAEYHRGLCDDEGKPAGAGYCITQAGIEAIEALIKAHD